MSGLVLAAISVLSILMWTVLAFLALGASESVPRWWRKPGNQTTGVIVVLALAVLMGGIVGLYQPASSPWHDLGPELIGISVTILVIDILYGRRASQQEKLRVIEQMSSPANDAALEGVRLARKHGWITDGSLADADLSRANLRGADLQRAKLESADLYDANLVDAILWEANLGDAFMMRANLKSADLANANLVGADLQYAVLWGAILNHANLEGASLIETNLSGAHLRCANLQNANLEGADLKHVELVGANLRGAVYNNCTIWPERFDPEVAGAINIDEQPEDSLPSHSE